jgi:hypothetical protein
MLKKNSLTLPKSGAVLFSLTSIEKYNRAGSALRAKMKGALCNPCTHGRTTIGEFHVAIENQILVT